METLPLAQPFGTGHREPQALRETQPAGATCAAEEAPMAPLHRPGRAGGWTGFLTRILRPTPEISGPRRDQSGSTQNFSMSVLPDGRHCDFTNCT